MLYRVSLALLLTLSVEAQQQPTGIFVTPAEFTPFVDEVEALGTLQSSENVELTSTVTERITRINFNDGQRVMKGTLLIEMDAAEELAEKIEEQSRAEEAQRQVDRLQPLVERGAASKSELDQQMGILNTAQARIKAIDSRINERRIVAPFDGVVGLRNLSVGALARPGTLLTNLDDDSVMKLDFSVPEIYLASLQPGIALSASTSAYPDTTFTATIHSVDSRVDPISRSIKARALLDNSDRKIFAGMLMQVVLKKNPRQSISIPEAAIITRAERQLVMTVVDRDGTTIAEQRAVTVGIRKQGRVEILSGIDSGDKVIHHGAFKVKSGAPVIILAIDESGNATLSQLLDRAQAKSTTQP